MWLDNASEVDILFYEPYANVIADISQNPNYKPLTIGVFGVWGAGKSTLLKLIKQKIDEKAQKKEKTLCININAWMFEGYEDAKVALMEALLREIKEHKDIPSKVKDGISKLLKKLDLFKLATKAVSVGAPLIASAATGNPVPFMISISTNAEAIGESVKNTANAVQSIRDDYIKTDEVNDENSVVNNVRKFREEFQKALEDDAIENYTVNLDKEYIEKIIQLPIYIPELSSKDIENYLMFLVVQEYCPKEQFKAFLEKIKKEKLLISDDAIDVQKIKEKAMEFIGDENKRKFEETVDVIAGIKAIVAGNLKGNPRQTKRFLNTYITKKKLAELYFGTDEGALDTRVLAKLLVLQKLDNDLFIQLNEWNKRFTTENEEFKAMLECIESPDNENEKFKAWNVPSIIKWVESEPKHLEKIRLDRYFYLTRESLKKADVDISTLSAAAKDVLEHIGRAARGLMPQIVEKIAALNAVDQSKVFEVVTPKIKKGEIEFYIIRSLFVNFEAYRDKICNALEGYSKKITLGSVPAIREMRAADLKKVDDLLATWEKSGILEKKIIEEIKKEGK